MMVFSREYGVKLFAITHLYQTISSYYLTIVLICLHHDLSFSDKDAPRLIAW